MDTDIWYDENKDPYILLTLVLPSSLNEDMQKALDCIQFPGKYGIHAPERIRIFDVDSDPYWESPKIKILIDILSPNIEATILAIKAIETIVNNGRR